MLSFVINCIDPTDSEVDVSSAFQREAMFHAVHLNEITDLRQLREEVIFRRLLAADMISEMNNACMWNGVTCIDNKIRSIEWSHRIMLKFLDVEWIPPTTQKLKLSNLQRVKKSPLNTRVLPRELKDFTIESCAWQGSLDMTTLPQHLESLLCTQNMLHGEIRLTNLPPTLKTVQISYSWTGTMVIDSSAIPDGFHEMTFIHTAEIRAIEIHGNPIDPRIKVYRFSARRHGMNQVKL